MLSFELSAVLLSYAVVCSQRGSLCFVVAAANDDDAASEDDDHLL